MTERSYLWASGTELWSENTRRSSPHGKIHGTTDHDSLTALNSKLVR